MWCFRFVTHIFLGLYSLSDKTSYRQISWSLEDARVDVTMTVSHFNLTGISAALLLRCLSNSRGIGKVWTRISRLRDSRKSCNTWWRHQMEHFPRYWPIVRGIHRLIPRTKASDAELPFFFFDLRLNKPLSKQSWGWWFETLSRSLWRHGNEDARSLSE